MTSASANDGAHIRTMVPEDVSAVMQFARALPIHDLLFLRRDIRNENVVRAWIEQLAQGAIRSLLAVSGDEVVGCTALVRDPLSWSPHVVEMRVLVSPDARGAGLGRRLAEQAFTCAVQDDAEKIVVHITPDQSAALSIFEEMGFKVEAMLRDHVRDAEGIAHDVAILSLNLKRAGGQHRAFGMDAI